MSTETRYVLRSTSKYRGKTLWFERMTAIGPMTTDDPAKRAEFRSREEAAFSPAMGHLLSFWEIEEVAAK